MANIVTTSNEIELGQALLLWISTYPVAKSVTSFEDLQTGSILWKVLQDIAPEAFTPSPPSQGADSIETRSQQLNYVKDHLSHYLIHECEQPVEVIGKLEPDVRAIAVDISEYETVKLLKLVLLAAVLTPSSNDDLVKTMDTLGPRVARPVQRCIEELTGFQLSPTSDADRPTADDTGDDDSNTHSTSKDDELSTEERLIEATAASKHMEEQNTALTSDLSALRDELAQLKLNAQHQQPPPQSPTTTTSKELRDEQSDTISALEEELFHSRAQVSAQTKQLASLAAIQASRDRLETERDILHQERDQLQQKSNAADNLAKKVKLLQEAQHATDLLQHAYDASQQELNELRPLREQCESLEQRLNDLTEYVDSIEQETSGERHAREEAENELSFLNQSLLESRAQNQRDQEVLGEYQGRLQELETTREDFSTLDQELSFSSPMQSPMQSPTVSQHAPTTPGTGDGAGRSPGSEIHSLRARLALAEKELAAARNTDNNTTNNTHTNNNTSTTPASSPITNTSPQSTRNTRALKKELDAMTDAWYDITRRMQSDAVVMQRRSEAPKSWLGKMRRGVVGGGSGMGMGMGGGR